MSMTGNLGFQRNCWAVCGRSFYLVKCASVRICKRFQWDEATMSKEHTTIDDRIESDSLVHISFLALIVTLIVL